MISSSDILRRRITEEKNNVKEIEQKIKEMEEMLINEAVKEKDLHIGDAIEVVKEGTINAVYRGVVGGFEMLENSGIKVTVFKFRNDGKTPSKQIHPNGSALIEEVSRTHE